MSFVVKVGSAPPFGRPLPRSILARQQDGFVGAIERDFLKRKIRDNQGSPAIWDSQRRACVKAHFDTYFCLSLSDAALPIKQIDELVERADESTFVQSEFRRAARTERQGRGTLVPIFLDELTVHAS